MATILQIEKKKFDDLMNSFKGKPKGYRLGQHLYHGLELQKLSDQEFPDKLWNYDGDKAKWFFLSFVELC